MATIEVPEDLIKFPGTPGLRPPLTEEEIRKREKELVELTQGDWDPYVFPKGERDNKNKKK